MTGGIGNELFKKQQELITFDFIDIASGNAYIHLYLSQALDTTGDTSQFISSAKAAAYPRTTNNTLLTTESPTFTKEGDYDFDILINKPIQILGKVFMENTIAVSSGNTSSNRGSMYALVKLRKWDGTTETELGSAQTSTITAIYSGSVNVTRRRQGLVIDITTKQKIKKGEYLRVTVEIWGNYTASASTQTGSIYTDPSNLKTATDEQSDEIPTDFGIYIPIVIDL